MLCCTVPEGIRKVVDRFKDIYTGNLERYNNQCALFCLFLFGLDTLSATVRSCPWSHSVSELSRAVNGIDGNRSMRRLRRRILRHYKGDLSKSEFCLAIDDTSNPRYGNKIFRCGTWGSSSGLYHGQKIVVLALIDINSDFALPLSYRFATKKCDSNYISVLDHAIEMLKEAKESGFIELAVVCDSWFDSADFMRRIVNLGMIYAGEIKANRKVRANPGRSCLWKKPKDLFLKLKRVKIITRCDRQEIRKGKKTAKSIATSVVYIRGLKKALRGIAVYNRKNGVKAFGYYVSTDLSMTGAKLWELARARWRIERLFRDLKQNLSFGKLPCGGEAGSDVAVVIPFILLVSLRLDPPENWGLKKADVIGTMVKQIREIALEKAIDIILINPQSKVIMQLRGRRTITKVNKKPVNSPAEVSWKLQA